MAIYSYTRVSTLKDQTTVNQDILIKASGFAVDKSFSDTGVSGSIAAFDRPAFKELLNTAVEGDTVVCTKIDRLGRTASDVLQTVEYFKTRKIKLRILQLDAVDLTSSMGKLVLTMLAAVAEMERNLTSERTKDGLQRTKEEGTILGKPLKYNPEQMYNMWQDSLKMKMLDVSNKYNVSLRQLTRYRSSWFSAEGIAEYTKIYNAQQLQKWKN